MLFDDDRDTAELTVSALDGRFSVDLASSYESLASMMRENRYDVIVTDVRIADYNRAGYMIVNDLLQEHSLEGVPVIVYSAVVNVEDIKKSEGNNYYDYVEKIISGDQNELVSVCVRALNESSG